MSSKRLDPESTGAQVSIVAKYTEISRNMAALVGVKGVDVNQVADGMFPPVLRLADPGPGLPQLQPLSGIHHCVHLHGQSLLRGCFGVSARVVT